MSRAFRSAVLAATVVALGVSVPAAAAPPVITPYEFSGTAVQQENCPGGYDVLVEFEGSGLNKVFFDKDGSVDRVWDWAKGSGTLINSEDPTKTLTGSSPNSIVWDLDKMTFSIRGMLAHNNVPGEGRVAHDSGVLVYELLSFQLDPFDFELGDLLHAGGKHPDSIDWCSMVD
jgi:hypothetical protein